MASVQRRFVEEKITRRKKLRGKIATPPTMLNIGGEDIWVADVILSEEDEILEKVPISAYNFNVRFADIGAPVELERDSAGILQIIGRSGILKGPVKISKREVSENKFGFTQGLKINPTSGNYETGNDNEVTIPPLTTETHQYTTRYLTYGELSPYGFLPYGAREVTKEP